MSEAAIKVSNLSLKIGKKNILQNISIDFQHGELCTLIGPNGAGKSSLLSTIAGDYNKYSGDVFISGKNLQTWQIKHLAKTRGMLLQKNTVFFPFTVSEIVTMGRSPWRGDGIEKFDKEIIKQAMIDCDVYHLRKRHLTELSGGEQARVALARVICTQTPILMLDEPTASLDIKHQEDVLKIARKKAESGCCVIVVLHDLALAAAYSDKIALLSNKKLYSYGEPRHVLKSEILSKVYNQEIDVFDHPLTQELLVQPRRNNRIVKEN